MELAYLCFGLTGLHARAPSLGWQWVRKVVAGGNSVLIMPRSRAQDVKKVIPSQK